MIRIGIVGAGIIGASHKNAITEHKDCCLTAVCDISLEKAQHLAEGTQAHVYTDYREMQEAEHPDAVILNLPHFLHKEVSVYFLNQKVAVLVEKPMANTVQECDEMIEASRRNNTPLAVGHVQRYFACYRKLRELMHENRFGKLCQITETRNTYYFNEKRPKWFLNKKQAGGGILMNYGAHTLDKIFYTTGLKAESVTAAGSNFLTEDDVEASAQLLVKFVGGVSALLSYCGCRVPNQYENYFYFTDGAAKIVNSHELWLAEPGEEFHRVELKEKLTFHWQLEEFLKLMAGKESEIATPEYGREIISVLEKAFAQF